MPLTVGPDQVDAVSAAGGWSSTANAVDAGMTDTTSASITQAGTASPGAITGFLVLDNFGVLTEDGGTIPSDALITRVLFQARVGAVNGTASAGAAARSQCNARVQLNGSSVGTLTPAAQPGTGNGASDISTAELDFPGSVASPQTTFTRADFLNTAVLTLETWGSKVSAANALGGTATLRCYWGAVTIEYVRLSQMSGLLATDHALHRGVRSVTVMRPVQVVEGHDAVTAERDAVMGRGGRLEDDEQVQATARQILAGRGGQLITDHALLGARRTDLGRGGLLVGDLVLVTAGVTGNKFRISGVTRTAAGAVLASATVELLSATTRNTVQSTVSSAAGVFSFDVAGDGALYYLRAEIDATGVHGTTADDKVAVATAFYNPG